MANGKYQILSEQELQHDLETRTAALFKRDEMMLSSDQELTDLREELREQDRELAASNESLADLKSQLASTDSELHEHEASRSELKQSLTAVELELQSVRYELTTTFSALETSKQEQGAYQEALASATGEVEHHRAKCVASTRHLSVTQSVIVELAPMLRSLETTLGSGHSSESQDSGDAS
jgi:chromosome segregation ATPase